MPCEALELSVSDAGVATLRPDSQPVNAIGRSMRHELADAVEELRDADVATAGLLEPFAQSTLLRTEDHREGVESFRAGRDSEFTGR